MKKKMLLVCFLSVLVVSCGTINGKTEKKSTVADRITSIDSLIKAGPSRIVLNSSEQELYRLILEYRKTRGLTTIPISKSLSFVAKIHVRDLEKHAYHASFNFHSWSGDGPWKSVNYTPDHRYAKLMWDKPRELTNYKGNGYEIAFMSPEGATPRGALSSWKSSKLHKEVIINDGIWKKLNWQAIGIGIHGKYAVVWFGEEIDPEI